MIIVVQCKQCEQRYALPSEVAGTKRKCKKCGATIRVPAIPLGKRLRKVIANSQFKRFLRRAVITAVVITCVAAVVYLMWPPTAEEIRVSVRQTLFGHVTTDAGIRFWSEMDNGETSETIRTRDGRFRQTFHYPKLSLTESCGFDGETLWEQSISGAVREIRHWARNDLLFTSWVNSGYWTNPQAPFLVNVNTEESTDSAIALDLALVGSRCRGTICVNRTTWQPESFVTEIRGETCKFQYGKLQKTPCGNFPCIQATFNGATYNSVTEDGTRIVHSDFQFAPVDLTPVLFLKPTDTAVVSFTQNGTSTMESFCDSHAKFRVSVTVEGEKGWFLLDTGATTSVISNRFAKKLDLPYIDNGRGSGIGGFINTERRLARRIEVGPLRLEMVPLDQLPDFGESDGLLGCDVLKYCVVDINYSANRISLSDPTRYELPSGRWEPLLIGLASPHLQTRISGESAKLATFCVDTGAQDLIVVPRAVVERFSNQKGTLGAVHGLGGAEAALASHVEWIVLGNRRFEDVEAHLVVNEDLSSFNQIDGIIGSSLLRQFRIVFDLSNCRMAFISTGT